MQRAPIGRVVVEVALAVVLVLGLGASAWAQSALANLLIGKWHGEVQGAFAGNRARILVIETVSESTATGRFGVSEDRLGRVPIAIQQTGSSELALEFTTTARDTVSIPWRLKLASPSVRVGTVYHPVRGAPGRIEYPATFRKAE